jgi:hypothetical protein
MNRWYDEYTYDDDLNDDAAAWLQQATKRQTEPQTTPQPNNPQPNNPQPTHNTVDNAPKLGDHNNQTDIHTNQWKDHAACKGSTHKMFPREHKDITYIQEARAICNTCTVKPQCLDYALSFPPGDMHGVWAGLTPRQLGAEQKKRKIRPTIPTLAQMWQDLQ